MKSQTKMGKKLDKILKNKLKNIKKAKPILIFPDGSKYYGMTKKNPKNIKKLLADGLGFCRWPDGQYYEGQYENGLFHGWGQYIVPGSHILVGLWKKGFITELNVWATNPF